MRQFYDPRIETDYPSYFCRGVQQAASVLFNLSSEDFNESGKPEYTVKTHHYLTLGSSISAGQTLDRDYDFNIHTVNEMFEFLTVLNRLGVVRSFGRDEIDLDKESIDTLGEIAKGGLETEIRHFIENFGFTSHARTNGFRKRRLPKI